MQFRQSFPFCPDSSDKDSVNNNSNNPLSLDWVESNPTGVLRGSEDQPNRGSLATDHPVRPQCQGGSGALEGK